jgi:hypothetical protein
VKIDEPLDDGEAQPRAAVLGGEEGFEDSVADRRVDARAAIEDFDVTGAIGGRDLDPDRLGNAP